jgi:rhodanese-related sulfurtransferase
MNFPLTILQTVSAEAPWTYLVFALIGFAFGFTLEMSGFGNSEKLAAQFYFKDLTVLKVMFTAIVVAMLSIFTMVGLGILNFNLVWVNLTYLSSGLLGGLIMGVGFVIGGFCPGTSVVSAATGKIDGIIFLIGGFFGAFLFGETEQYFTNWYNNAGYYGRLTLMDAFGLSTGWIVLLVVLMAIFMFWGGEQLERIFAKKDLSKEPKIRILGAGVLVLVAIAIIFIGSPSNEEKYAKVTISRTVEEEALKLSPDQVLENQYAQISPAELFKTMNDDKLSLTIIDVRDEADYNLFHIKNSVNMPLSDMETYLKGLLSRTDPNVVNVLVSNDEELSTNAWKYLVGESVPNLYILQGGVNNWIAVFGETDPEIQKADVSGIELLKYTFPSALGDRYECSDPSPIEYEKLEYLPVIQLQLKRDKSGGGCG